MLAKIKKIQDWFFKKQVYLFDLDGTLYLGSRLLPGSQKLIQKLRADKKRIYFFTNNSSRSEADYLKKLTEMGFQPSLDEIVMSTHSLIAYLKINSLKKIFLLGTPAMHKMLKQAGIQTKVNAPKVQAVVVGFDKTLTYKKLKLACEFIESGIPYVVTHPDLYCPTDRGREPDCGAFAEVLRLVTEKKALAVLGKPNRAMIDLVLKRSGASKKQMLLVGDRLSTDILMARQGRIESLLVFSGETTPAKLKSSMFKPTHSLRSVADLCHE